MILQRLTDPRDRAKVIIMDSQTKKERGMQTSCTKVVWEVSAI